MHHPTYKITYHGLCYTSRGSLAGTHETDACACGAGYAFLQAEFNTEQQLQPRENSGLWLVHLLATIHVIYLYSKMFNVKIWFYK